MKKIQIINGPNLNLLGKREPGIYGKESFEDYFSFLLKKFPEVELHYYQSNHEGGIIDKLHSIGFDFDGIIINPGAYTHYSYAIADALAAIDTPAIEVHISNIFEREDFRKISVTHTNCLDMVSGKGLAGYEIAIKKFLDK